MTQSGRPILGKQTLGTEKLDKETVTKAYARWAPVYDLVFGAVFERGRSLAIEAAERIGGRILEVGVGTGLSLPHYSSANRICGVDISEPMLLKAKERVAALNLTHVEGLWVMDAERLAFADASFDVIVAQYVITTVPNPEGTLDEFARVLKPGGEIVLVSRSGGRRPQGTGKVVRSGRPEARLAHRILVQALCHLGRPHARNAARRAARHTALWPLRSHTVRQGYRPVGATQRTVHSRCRITRCAA
jgi:SAM-dependent methyltransferase